MSYIYKITWNNDTQYEEMPQLGDISTDPIRVYWEDSESVSEVQFFMHGSLLMMEVRYSNENGFLKQSWCLGHFVKNVYAQQFVEYVMAGYVQTQNLAHCPAVAMVDWDGPDAYTLGGELITSEMFSIV